MITNCYRLIPELPVRYGIVSDDPGDNERDIIRHASEQGVMYLYQPRPREVRQFPWSMYPESRQFCVSVTVDRQGPRDWVLTGCYL